MIPKVVQFIFYKHKINLKKLYWWLQLNFTQHVGKVLRHWLHKLQEFFEQITQVLKYFFQKTSMVGFDFKRPCTWNSVFYTPLNFNLSGQGEVFSRAASFSSSVVRSWLFLVLVYLLASITTFLYHSVAATFFLPSHHSCNLRCLLLLCRLLIFCVQRTYGFYSCYWSENFLDRFMMLGSLPYSSRS